VVVVFGLDVVVVVAPRPPVVVDVVVLGVVVVVLPALDDVVVVLDDVVVDELVVVVVVPAGDVVVVVVEPGEDGLRMLEMVGPVSLLPKIDARGLPAISSMAVINNRANTKTMALVPAMAFQENFRPISQPSPGLRSPCPSVPSAATDATDPTDPADPTGGTGTVRASRRSVAGASATAEISSRFVSSFPAPPDSILAVSSAAGPTPTTWVGATSEPGDGVPADDDAASPAEAVPPSRRNNGDADPSWTRTATCLTACWPRSIDCVTRAEPMVAAAEPMATPMIVPLTPKFDAISAASTAPMDEAMICR
jgi:hypothetical protein